MLQNLKPRKDLLFTNQHESKQNKDRRNILRNMAVHGKMVYEICDEVTK